MPGTYIVIWRQSPTARFLDVQLDNESKIAVFSADETSFPIISSDAELIEYINSKETEKRQVDADLAHKVLGWEIPE